MTKAVIKQLLISNHEYFRFPNLLKRNKRAALYPVKMVNERRSQSICCSWMCVLTRTGQRYCGRHIRHK